MFVMSYTNELAGEWRGGWLMDWGREILVIEVRVFKGV